MTGISRSERFARLAQEFDAGRSQYEEEPRPSSCAPGAIDDTPHGLEDVWRPVNLIEDHEPTGLPREEELRLPELGEVRRGLQIQIDRRRPFRDLKGERGLAYLAWADDGDGGLSGQSALKVSLSEPGYHSCIFNILR